MKERYSIAVDDNHDCKWSKDDKNNVVTDLLVVSYNIFQIQSVNFV